MVSGKYKSRTFRRVFTKTATKTVIHYKRRRPSKPVCASCGTVLKGVHNLLPYKMKNMPKTKKRPSRAFGGVLCSKCSRDKIKQEARK
jgi:large subunit ribosomal protein L34e